MLKKNNNTEMYHSKHFTKIKNMCKLIIDCRLLGILELYEKGFNYQLAINWM